MAKSRLKECGFSLTEHKALKDSRGNEESARGIRRKTWSLNARPRSLDLLLRIEKSREDVRARSK